MIKRSSLKFIFASGLISLNLTAHADRSFTTNQPNLDDQIYVGSFQTVIELNPKTQQDYAKAQLFSTENLTQTKVITLMRVNPTYQLTARAESVAESIELGLTAEQDYSGGISEFKESNSATDLKMNNVPVLDQLHYGTCVTFATTAALDAVLGKGDIIDQQCGLAHNLYLGNNYWDGAYYASQIIDPLQKYGVVEKSHCPQSYPTRYHRISTEDYKKVVSKDITLDNIKYKYHRYIEIDDVRKAINNGRRVAIGFMLKGNDDRISVQGFDILVDGKKRKGGLWACKQQDSKNNYCGYAQSGHEVVVTGYDDAQGLLKIRNSWSQNVADSGDFYMTYAFFSAMAIDGTEIWSEEV